MINDENMKKNIYILFLTIILLGSVSFANAQFDVPDVGPEVCVSKQLWDGTVVPCDWEPGEDVEDDGGGWDWGGFFQNDTTDGGGGGVKKLEDETWKADPGPDALAQYVNGGIVALYDYINNYFGLENIFGEFSIVIVFLVGPLATLWALMFLTRGIKAVLRAIQSLLHLVPSTTTSSSSSASPPPQVLLESTSQPPDPPKAKRIWRGVFNIKKYVKPPGRIWPELPRKK